MRGRPGLAARRRPLPRRHRPGHLAGPPRRRSPPGRTARRTCRPAWRPRARECSPRTTTATPASSRPAACSSSARRPPGVQIADELEPGRPRGDPRGRPAHPDAPPLPRYGHLLVAGEHRPARPDHRRDARPGGRAARAVAAARRPQRRRASCTRTSTWRRCRPRGAAGRPARRRRPVARPGSATTCARHVGAADARMHRFLDAVDELRRPGRPRRARCGQAAAARDRSTCRPRRPGWTCGPRASARSCSPPATGRTTPGCGCRSPRRTGPSASTAASPRRRGSTSSGQRFQHRRDSASSTAPGTTRARRRPPAGPAPRRAEPDDRVRSARMNGYDVVVVGGRVAGASTALLLARAGARVAVVERRPTRQRHGLHARRSCAPGCCSCPAGGCSTMWSRPGRRRSGARRSTTPTGSRVHVSIRPSAGRRRAVRPAPHLLDRILVDAAEEAGARVMHETR